MVRTVIVAVALTLTAGSGLSTAFARTAQPIVVAARDNGISQAQAARLVAARTGGRVLSAQTVRTADGSTVYLIRVLLDKGRVRVYRVDARTGRIH